MLITLPYFFPQAGKTRLQSMSWAWKSTHSLSLPPPPPPPSYNVGCGIKHTHTHTHSHYSFFKDPTVYCFKMEREGGVDLHADLPIFFCHLEEKTQGHFFHRKRVGMANFSGFWATWNIVTKSVPTYAYLAWIIPSMLLQHCTVL